MENLTSKEMRQLRNILRKKEKERREAQEHVFFHEKEGVLWSIRNILELLGNTSYFKDTTCDFTQGRPVIWWKNGANIKLGAPGYFPADPGNFKEIGLKGGIYEFYKLPLEKRNAFLREVARKIVSIATPYQLRVWKKQVKLSENLIPFLIRM